MPVQLVALVDDHVSVDDWPDDTDVGEAAIVAVGAAAAETVTAVHAPQLSDSFDSVITPVFAEELLSAQTRTYHVAAEGKVCESETPTLPPAATEDAANVPMSVDPAPAALVARWKRLVKPAPVDPPTFVTVPERVTAAPTVADVGVTEPEVRLGCAAATVTTALTVLEFPPVPVQ